MKITAKYDGASYPPKVKLVIHGAPHRRMHIRMIQEYRKQIAASCLAAGIAIPIKCDIDLDVTLIDPTTPDIGNAYLALEQAMDHKTLKGSGPGLLYDDSLVSELRIRKLFTEGTRR